MVGVRVARIELDEVWSFVGKKQRRVKAHEAFAKSGQYVCTALASTPKAIISYRKGSAMGPLRTISCRTFAGRVLGWPEISTEALTPDMRRQTTPAMALGITDHIWSIGELLGAAACGRAACTHRDGARSAPSVSDN
jgi:hypothetical protein